MHLHMPNACVVCMWSRRQTHGWFLISHYLYSGSCRTLQHAARRGICHAGKGGSNWGPNTLNMSNTKERGTSSEEPWDEEACARLLNETIRILEETTGDKLPVP